MLESKSAALAASRPAATALVRPLEDGDHAAWDRFVLDHPHGSPFHLIAWKKSIEQTFGYRPTYLLATGEGGAIRGVLPLFLVQNWLMGKVLISSPFAVYGGILADSADTREALCARARQLGEQFGVKHVEFRNAWEEQTSGLPRLNRYVTFTQAIGPDEAAILETIPRKTRAAVRKSLKSELSSRQETSDPRVFEDLYSRNLRKLGTPSFPPCHFQALLDNFRGMADIREVRLCQKTVAAVFNFYFRDQVLPYYGASDPAYNAAQPNNFMYFDLMRWAGANGYGTFDFGRSKRVKGSYDFKAHWGMVERELPYEVMLIGRKELPNYSPANPVFRLPILCWQRLPLAVTRVLGPHLIRFVP